MSQAIAIEYPDRYELWADSGTFCGPWEIKGSAKLCRDGRLGIVVAHCGLDNDGFMLKSSLDLHEPGCWLDGSIFKDRALQLKFINDFNKYVNENCPVDRAVEGHSSFIFISKYGMMGVNTNTVVFYDDENFMTIGSYDDFADGCLLSGKSPKETLEMIHERGGIYCSPPFIHEVVFKEEVSVFAMNEYGVKYAVQRECSNLGAFMHSDGK